MMASTEIGLDHALALIGSYSGEALFYNAKGTIYRAWLYGSDGEALHAATGIADAYEEVVLRRAINRALSKQLEPIERKLFEGEH